MDNINRLFTDDVKEILEHEMRTYPLYVYFIDFFLCGEKYKLLAGEEPPTNPASTIWKVLTATLPFYIKNAFRNKPTFNRVDIAFLSKYRPVDDSTRGPIKTDYLFQNIIAQIHKNHPHLNMALGSVGFREERYTDYRASNFNLFDFLSPKLIAKSVLHSVRLYLKYRKRKTAIREQLGSAERIYSEFFSLYYLAHLHLLDFCLGEAIENLHPKVIVLNNDVPLNLKPAPDPRLIVLQAALFGKELENWRGQLFSNFASRNTRLSDCFCVSGPQAKLVKEKFGKDTKRVLITGQSRFDKLAKASELLDKNEVCKKFGLDPQAKNLLWATQTQSGIETKKNISVVYNGVSSLENVRLIIKPHPTGDQNASLYRKDSPIVPVIVQGDSDISELLYVCDTLITKDSTTGIEAAILGKPIIVLNLMGEPYRHVSYVQEGIAIGVYKRQDFLPAIKDALYNEEVRGKLAKAREKFIYDNAYLVDGQASKRVADLIIQMIEESREPMKRA